MKSGSEQGFTLVELLVALAILGSIVVICGRIFEQSNSSWSTGARRAEMNMTGRGIANFIAQDISRCVAKTSAELVISGPTLTFKIVDENSLAQNVLASPLKTITYSLGNPLTRKDGNTVTLAPDGLVDAVTVTKDPAAGPQDLPGYVDVEVRVRDTDSLVVATYKSRAWLANRDRYKYEQ